MSKLNLHQCLPLSVSTLSPELRLTVHVGMPESSVAIRRPLSRVVTRVSGMLSTVCSYVAAFVERHRRVMSAAVQGAWNKRALYILLVTDCSTFNNSTVTITDSMTHLSYMYALQGLFLNNNQYR